MAYFARQGRALNAELRGHGESDKPRQAYSIEVFAEDLVWLCAQQQVAKPVIVGQSMGGNMALEIAARYPDFPAGLVLLDSGVMFPASAGTVFAGYLAGLKRPDFADEARKIVADSCLPTDRCRAHVEQTFLATPQHVLVSTFESLFPWDQHRARECAKACRVPVLYIEAAHRLADLDAFIDAVAGQNETGDTIHIVDADGHRAHVVSHDRRQRRPPALAAQLGGKNRFVLCDWTDDHARLG
jgi:pimeloyl-ACP methyl ester carboxylesterase